MSLQALSSHPQIQQLHVNEVVHYLHQNYWTTINHLNPKFVVFEKGTDDDGKPIQIVLPSHDEYEDRPYLIAKAINLLSVLDSVDCQEILNQINANIHVI